MDLNQRKLTRSEWNSIEVPISEDEINILKLLKSGYYDTNIKINNTHSIFTFLKIEYNEKMEDYLYNKYLRKETDVIEEEIYKTFPEYKKMKIDGIVKLNSIDRLRLERFDENSLKKIDIYEFVLLFHCKKIVEYKNQSNTKMFHFHYFTLYKLSKNHIIRLNRHVIEFVKKILNIYQDEIQMSIIIENGFQFIEKNENLLKYGDMTLYDHQKEIFTICKNPNPKLILYMAPTGTGKTLTPIALSEEKKIIFVCAARHVGLALAKSAISVNKKVAFAFGCASGDDIRLHYFAAKEFTRNKKTGGIGKVDNSVGDNVEIMICDIKSYLPAMYYMLAFFKAKDIILYWDEPTITMDYDDHVFHDNIHKNWKENKIPNVVLSSATLPKLNELTETIPNFLNQFKYAKIFNIVSHDCKKSIPIINKDGFVVLPHYLSSQYEDILKIANHCENYLTLLRYFDLKEVIEFIHFIFIHEYTNKKMAFERHFDTLNEVTMTNIKIYYVKLLQNISPENWQIIYEHFIQVRQPRIFENTTVDTKGNRIFKINSVGPGINKETKSKSLAGAPITKLASEQILPSTIEKIEKMGTSGGYVTTKDAYTLTDGPTIFISNDIEKIAKFCIQQANIPASIMEEISKKIEYNNAINERLCVLESEIDLIKEQADKKVKNAVSDSHAGTKVASRNKSKDSKKVNKDCENDGENRSKLSKLTQEVNSLRGMIKYATLNDAFVPNKKMHLERWANDLDTNGSFSSNVDEQTVCNIMALNGVENSWKVLLMMGIGVFMNHENITYVEIMKKLADEQKLYMIIASSDYIYGTNYQFCHGYLSKDLDLTQEKIIQAMGRIGRTNIQKTYTIRFRDDQQILKLFTSETDKPEIINMNRLFHTQKVIWKDNNYIEFPEEHEDDKE
jgi:hypothetical protein